MHCRSLPSNSASPLRDDMSETIEIGRSDLAPAQMFDIDPFAFGSRDRPPIRRFADMPIAGPGRIDFNVETKRLCLNAEGRLREWRAADVAKTHKENGRFSLHQDRAPNRPAFGSLDCSFTGA